MTIPIERTWAKEVEQAIETWGMDLEESAQPRLVGMAPGFRKAVAWLKQRMNVK